MLGRGRTPPPPTYEQMTHAYENITFPASLRYVVSNNRLAHPLSEWHPLKKILDPPLPWLIVNPEFARDGGANSPGGTRFAKIS